MVLVPADVDELTALTKNDKLFWRVTRHPGGYTAGATQRRRRLTLVTTTPMRFVLTVETGRWRKRTVVADWATCDNAMKVALVQLEAVVHPLLY
jgi:hypothetical protein